MTEYRRSVASLVAFVATAGTAVAAPGQSVHFAPHRAVYDITLDRATPGSGIEEMSGRMVYELQGSACEGYTQNMRFVTRMVDKNGGSQINDLRTSSWEDAAAKRLRFNTSQYKDETLIETTQGDAERRSPARDGIKVELAKPTRKSTALKGDVYFPMQHSLALIDAARSGKTKLVADLYDGSEKGEKVYATNALIGRLVAPGTLTQSVSEVKGAKDLDKLKSWPIAISYFEPGAEKRDAVPSYELAFRFFDNGVSTGLRIDYGEFAIRGELKALEYLEATACDAAATR